MIKKLLRAILGCLIAFIFHFPCSAKEQPKNKQLNKNDVKEITLALNWKPEPQFGGFYAAEVHGFFAREGLQVKILEGGSGTPTIQMLNSQKVDFSIVSGDEVILSHDRGAVDSRVLFAVFQINPQSIMIHKNKSISSLKELVQQESMTLLWQQGLPYAQYLRVKYPVFKIQTAPYSGGISLFINNKNYAQQCFETSEPLLAKGQGLDTQTFSISESGFNPYTTVVATHRGFLEQNPDIVRRFMAAIKSGWEEYLKDPARTNSVMAKMNPAMDLASFSKSAQAQIRLIRTNETTQLGLGSMTESRWQELIGQMVELKLIKKSFPARNLIYQPVQ